MKLFETRTAPNPRRVRMFLAEKGLLDQVELVQVDIEKGENLSPDFVARNPMKKVPVLELDDSTCIAETMAICRYFEESYPDTPSLLGESPLEKPGGAVAALDRVLFHDAHRHVLSAHHRLFQGSDESHQGVGDECGQGVEKFMHFLNKQLEGKEYLCCDRFTAATLTLSPP